MVLQSHDRTMNSRLIAMDLLRSFLGNGGELKTNSTVTEIYKGDVSTDSESFHCKQVILAIGHCVKKLTGVNVKVVVSPLAVAYPSLTKHNFVRMTADLSLAFNHIYHSDGYSVMGNANYFSEINDEIDAYVKKSFVERIRSIFPGSKSAISVYYGHKTEVVGKSQLRNYQSHIINTGSCLVAIPGKFSLSFSLALSVCEYYGIKPVSTVQKLASLGEVEQFVVSPKHHMHATYLIQGNPSNQAAPSFFSFG